ncbi:MAG: hypothetical protein CMP07_01230 [Xanthomonadales bacterium]|nr:hypothetical protein [Xanthomonadales bacterium]|tara:strand:+ start:241 stop:672 length:432 start_codon:yes stop_codon:yes gene_type:complete
MIENRQKTARMLGWAGLIPFAALAVTAVIGAPESVQQLLIGYAVAILAFLAGSLWAGALERPADAPASLIASNLLLLAALPALLMPLSAAAGWLALMFALHLAAEWRWVLTGHPGWYRRLRLMLSGIAIALLLVAAMGGSANG